ncbi:MAP kinase kinase kinase mkh1-like [Vitis riparia]|uniref:MAP kinase kinase kinase mkh1-like n=1 Tax=Vitis riparia TaxID=96939 RepID=UPI00155A761B|nr:MAP kinase kinase kinase mkh1-like [Vitis riparia]
MAKEARESEGKKLKNNGMNSYLEKAGGGDADEDANSSIRSGIQEEVDARLLKLQKRLNATREKSPLPLVSHLNKFFKIENRVNGNHSDVAELNRTLMFKKKKKFRNAPSMPRNDPKWFQPLENSDISKEKKSISSIVDRIVDLPAGNSQQNDSSSLEEDCGRNALSKESSLLQNHGKKLEKGIEGKKIGGIVNLEFGTEVKELSSSFPGSLTIEPILKRGSNHEGQSGLYTLKTSSHESDPIDSSCPVAFEDRELHEAVDPTFFSFLLQPSSADLDPQYTGIHHLFLYRKAKSGVHRWKDWRCNGKGYVAYWNYIRRPRNWEKFLGIGPRPNTFSSSELQTATEDFNPANKLGEGGFWPVYKGALNDWRVVAVKQLSVASQQGKSQFVAAIAAISAVQHRNLVKLYGCYIEGNRRLLVYEHLENKSLDQALFGKNDLYLDWSIRFNICLGTARGLAYLHEDSRPRTVHRDVKASNILLDAKLCPKISDFGLAKLYDDKKTHISSRVAGTIGYLAPAYAMRGHLTEKADAFGFGVVALEILSGRPNSDNSLDTEKIYGMGMDST